MTATEKLEELLLEYSAGSLSETPSLLVATHLALSPASRKIVRDMEDVVGALFSLSDNRAVAVTPMDQDLLPEVEKETAPRRTENALVDEGHRLPEPLRSYVGDLDRVKWRRKLPGLKELQLPELADGCDAFLYKIKANRSMPQHTHHGEELTLVLEGGFSDRTGSYQAGDVAIADASIEHRPHADPDRDCVCLVVTDGPLRLTGPVGRLLASLSKLK